MPAETSKDFSDVQEILIKNQGFHELKAENENLKTHLAIAEKKANEFQNSISIVDFLYNSINLCDFLLENQGISKCC